MSGKRADQWTHWDHDRGRQQPNQPVYSSVMPHHIKEMPWRQVKVWKDTVPRRTEPVDRGVKVDVITQRLASASKRSAEATTTVRTSAEREVLQQEGKQ